MRMLAVVLSFLLATVPGWAAGAIAFDGNDAYLCDADFFGFDPIEDNGGIVLYITPGFSSSDTSTQTLISNIQIVNCPSPLPAGCEFITCGTGFGVFWDGGNSRFEGWLADDERCPGNVLNFRKCRLDSVSFDAGDLIGLYFWWAHQVNNCEAFIPADSGDTGSAFNDHNFRFANNEDMVIGAAGPGFHLGEGLDWFYNGAIDFLMMFNGRVTNLDNNSLRQLHKRSWFPMWRGKCCDNSGGGGALLEPIITFQMWNDDLASGSLCTKSGNPSPTTTRMMY